MRSIRAVEDRAPEIHVVKTADDRGVTSLEKVDIARTCATDMTRRLPRAVRARAFAKINLSLRVLSVRADGYHELRTTFQSIALHDTLTFSLVPGPMTLTCDDPGCPIDERNLVWQAAEAVWRAAGRRGKPFGVAIDIRKRVPMQAGLGGGSSDAAAALRALDVIWRARLSAERVHAEAKRLGADVPYFLGGGTALGVDRGDVLFPLVDAPQAAVVLVQPPFGVSTKDAYGWWDQAFHQKTVTLPSRTAGNRLGLTEWGNDLEPPVAQRHAEIGRIVRGLKRSGALGAAMSGSGSAVFGLFETNAAAMEAAAAAHARGRIVIVTRTLSRPQYRRLAAPR